MSTSPVEVFSDEELHLQQIVAALTAKNARPQLVEDLGEAAQRFDWYLEVHLAERQDPLSRWEGVNATRGWRITTVAVAKNATNARRARARARLALEGCTITVDGRESSEVVRDTTDDPIEADADGWYVGTTDWVYDL